MVLLMVVTVGYLPIVLPLLLPGITVNAWEIARSLLLLMLLPLAIGIALKTRYGELAARVKPVLDWISNVSLILLVCLITAANIDKVVQVFGTRAILAGLLFIVMGLGAGWLLGGPSADTKRVMALGTGQRNIAAALVVASQSFSDAKVVVMVIVVAIVGLIVLMPLSRALASTKTLSRFLDSMASCRIVLSAKWQARAHRSDKGEGHDRTELSMRMSDPPKAALTHALVAAPRLPRVVGGWSRVCAG